MKFKKLLTESRGIAYDFEMIQSRDIYPLDYYADHSVDEFEEKLWNGEDISKELNELDAKIRDYQRLGERIIEINNNPEIALDNEEDAKHFIINERNFRKYLTIAKKVLDAYIFKNTTVQDIMHVIKPGESIKSAVRKISRMTTITKYINTENFKVYQFFDEYSEDDILEQIEKFNGMVKLNGAMDTYIRFENGKAWEVYF